MQLDYSLQQQFQLLDEKDAEAVRLFIEFLLQKKQKTAPMPRKKPRPKLKAQPVAVEKTTVEEAVPERLRIVQQFRGTAPKPHFEMSKYDVYEQ